ncbi:LacI family DNA-binding transcriptional regulator [Rudaea cellulosilytica]|uniref:LacI family DNA-binding transcriptional regulator n=1 Tax=Rudaea cellulosilytica TaxID=540746 RepID=UPI0003739CF3|nr:LacI family DNA-binding transcriptional regulator [Rudaea cellulosilytica]
MPKSRRNDKAAAAPEGALTMADLARLAGVSKITVSRALSENGIVAAGTRDKVRALAAEHGYKLNVSARNLRLRQSHTIAVIVEMKPSVNRPMSDPYPLELLGGIAQELATANYSVLLTTRPGALAPAVQAADAVILLGQGARQQAVHLFDRLRLPMVVWGAPGADEAHVVVGSDNRQGGASAAERFVALGRHHPVFLGDTDHAEMAERHAGFVKHLKTHGIAPIIIDHKAFTAESGFEAVAGLLRKKTRFDAVFAINDLLAMGAVRALIEAGLRVPEDVTVIGYDDTPLGAAFIPPLTSVHQNWHEGGVLLARKALALFRGEKVTSETLPSRLVVRTT